MKKNSIKQILKKIFCLSPALTLLVTIPSFLLVIYVFANGMEEQAIAYVAYALSAYALVVAITGAKGVIHWLREGIMNMSLVKRVLKIPLVERFTKDVFFQTKTMIYQGLFINLLYAGVKLFTGVYYRSVWFVTLAVYYVLLAVMRFSLLLFVRKRGEIGQDKLPEWRRYRLCGIFLLFMDWTLAGIIILVVHQNRGFEYPEGLIYVMALYTFYATITAVINVIRFRKYGSPILSAAKVINLTAALVSMLSLETAMITRFGEADDAMFRQTMTSLTGAGVSMAVLGMAAFMIVRSTRQLKRMKKEEASDLAVQK